MQAYFKKWRGHNDLALRVLSVFLAVVLWKYVKSEQKQQRSLDVELEFVNLPAHLMLEREMDAQIRVRVVGPKSRVELMNQEYLGTLAIDLGKSHIGLNTFWIQEEDFSLPYGVKIDRIMPQIIRVDLDKAISKTLPVLPKFIGKLEEGFEMESYVVTPDKMLVRGPQRSMDSLTRLYTTAIDLKSLRSYFEQEIPIDVSSFKVNLQKEAVLVRIKIKENKVVKSVGKIAVEYDPEQYKIYPKHISIRVEGLAGDMLSFDQNNLSVELEGLSNLFQPAIRVEPQVKGLPQNVKYTTSPEKIRVEKIKR